MGVKVIRIYQLDGIVNAGLELEGGFFEVEVPAGPVAGGYLNKRLSFEQLTEIVGGAMGTPRDPFAIGDNPAITAAVLDLSNQWVKGDLVAYGSDALRMAGAPPAEAGQDTSILVGTADVATMDEFDKTDADGYAWRCRYSRRNDGTSGWTRLGETA